VVRGWARAVGQDHAVALGGGDDSKPGRAAIVAAADPQNRSLKNYLEGVAEPPTNDATATSRWLEALLRHLMAEKTSALVDLGGGDTSLHKLLTTVPDLGEALAVSAG
jgi:hypothetical protein